MCSWGFCGGDLGRVLWGFCGDAVIACDPSPLVPASTAKGGAILAARPRLGRTGRSTVLKHLGLL
jgi:hypothetical protein